jgi:hypothetical protein
VLDGDYWSASRPGPSIPKKDLKVDVNMFDNVCCVRKVYELYGYIKVNLMLFVNDELIFI